MLGVHPGRIPAMNLATATAPVTFGGLPLLAAGGPATRCERSWRGERWIGIADVDAMPPFFTTAVGDNECWLFAGSNGPLCAGRREPDLALFPYVNVDRIIDHPGSAGFLTCALIDEGDGQRLWEPWSAQPALHPRSRSLLRHELGAGLLFIERDELSGLELCAEIATSQRFGLVRRVSLINGGTKTLHVRLLDGFHRLLPPGLGTDTWASFSYLAQAYMRHERVSGCDAALYTLNAAITDRAEPREVLRCAAAWWLGAAPRTLLLSAAQVDAFRRGAAIEAESEIRGVTGALLGEIDTVLEPGATAAWTMGADTGLDQVAAGSLCELISQADAEAEVEEAIACDRDGLRARLAAHDGLSLTGDRGDDDAHRSSTLFNLMRGGVLPADLTVRRDDFAAWLKRRDRVVADRCAADLASWPERLDLPALAEAAADSGDDQLERLAGSYLPLAFSRRHGDPSRPWNRFNIRLFDEAGRPVSAWQGNWRDIFQNWEALSLSFPSALPAMIANFLDASTADGYNPYRITSEGVDWEVPEDGPWSHFGYWGDHQIVYLTRLLEQAEAHHPGWITARLCRLAHTCADVPYRIKPYAGLLADPSHGVTFDAAAQSAAEQRMADLGSDGRFLPGPDGLPLLMSMGEKLLIPVLAKLSNLVPGAGIWLNTQRPEWNDANNALVGWGCSLVTAFQLWRHLTLLRRVVADAAPVPVSAATADLLDELCAALPLCLDAVDPSRRRAAMDALGAAGETYRNRVYANDLGPKMHLAPGRIRVLLDAALDALDATLAAARREDGLFDSYVVIALEGSQVRIRHLDPMLEGQVAAFASGWLDPAEAVSLWRTLYASPLWDAQRRTFLLYPDRNIAPFLQRNRIAGERARRITLLATLLDSGDRRVVVADGETVRFSADLANVRELSSRLDLLGRDGVLKSIVARDRTAVLELWEETFAHRSYLGRSTTMFAFEGLGSVYWHMVSKLHLALAEAALATPSADPSRSILSDAAATIRAGLGPAKAPAEFGAFPFDPYSHTPAGRGAQQPGMTGQVKEEILARRARLGVAVEAGCITCRCTALAPDDVLADPGELLWVDLDGRERRLTVPAGALAITICQVPVLLRRDGNAYLIVRRDGSSEIVPGPTLPIEVSQAILHRSGTIMRIEITTSR
jgi:hypothetical protein